MFEVASTRGRGVRIVKLSTFKFTTLFGKMEHGVEKRKAICDKTCKSCTNLAIWNPSIL
jgi:hypothetical protein